MSRLPGLDGIRGVAVLGVLAYHLDLVWAGGGFLGVEIFFALSGFLITHLLMTRARRVGRIDVPAFARARARRLVPALAACVLLTLGAYRVLLPEDAGGLRSDALASLLYLQNWHLVLSGIPYGADFTRPPPMLHLWSLAVEVQLYLVWVLLLVGVVSRVRPRLGVGLTCALAVASAVDLALRYGPDGGELIYYATDARASGFLLGAALGLVWRAETWSAPLSRPGRYGLDVLGLLTLIGLLTAMARASEFDPDLYQRGGFLGIGLLSVLLIAMVTRADGLARRLLESRPLVYAGTRSYGAYLYHWPVFALVRGAPGQGWARDVAALAVTLVVTEASYRWLETPLRRDGLAALSRRLRLEPWTARLVTVWAAVMVVSLLAATGEPEPPPSPAGVAAQLAPAPPGAPGTLVVGDSITLGSAEALQAALGPTTVAAAVGLQFSAAPQIVADWVRSHDGPIVVNLGANGEVQPRDVDALLAAAGHRRVVLVGVSVPRRWRTANNDLLRATAGRAPGVVFVDWAALVKGHPGSLGPDRVHPGPQGRVLLASAVAAAVR